MLQTLLMLLGIGGVALSLLLNYLLPPLRERSPSATAATPAAGADGRDTVPAPAARAPARCRQARRRQSHRK